MNQWDHVVQKRRMHVSIGYDWIFIYVLGHDIDVKLSHISFLAGKLTTTTMWTVIAAAAIPSILLLEVQPKDAYRDMC